MPDQPEAVHESALEKAARMIGEKVYGPNSAFDIFAIITMLTTLFQDCDFGAGEFAKRAARLNLFERIRIRQHYIQSAHEKSIQFGEVRDFVEATEKTCSELGESGILAAAQEVERDAYRPPRFQF